MTFESPTPFDPSHPSALAIYCSDGRFTQPVEDLLHSLGHTRLDTMTMPGGAALLERLSASYTDADAMTRAAGFLITGHHIREIVLLAHAGCGYYAQRRRTDTPAQIETRQIADLRLASHAIEKLGASLVVHLYFARPIDGRVRFEPVARKP